MAAKMFFRKSVSGVLRLTVITVSGAILSSAILSYFAGLAGNDILFGGGLGGECGAAVVGWLANLAGYIVTGLSLLVFVVIWLLYTRKPQ